MPLPAWVNRDWLWGLILLLAIFLTYSPVWWAGFIWDDDAHLTANPVIIGPLGLKEIWTTGAAQYYPLVLTTFWLEHSVWGLLPLPYHLVNVLIHGLSAIVLWRVLQCLDIPGAWLGAALWALHPVQVETVAWVTELKNTQSGLFYLLSILFFVQWLKNKELHRTYALTLLFAALAMASKSSTVVLPFVLCLCSWWVDRKWNWKTFGRLVPVFLMSVAAAELAIRTVDLQGVNQDTQWLRSWPERLITAGKVFWFYLGKLVWPHRLIFVYPRWVIDSSQWFSYLPLAAAILVLFWLWLMRNTWTRPIFFALAYFLAALLPVLGLVEHYFLRYSFVADHLQYLASMGPLGLIGAGLVRLSSVAFPRNPSLHLSLAAGLLMILGSLSWHRCWVYENQDILWTDTLAQNPECWLAHNNFGIDANVKGDVDEAIVHFRKVLELNPSFAEGYNNLGMALLAKGQVTDAVTRFQEALKLRPTFDMAYNNLGDAYYQQGRMDDAMTQFRLALKYNPNFDQAHNNLGFALLKRGQADEAIVHFKRALELNPAYAGAFDNMGDALAAKGQTDEAIAQFKKALEIDPSLEDARYGMGNAYFQKGQLDEAEKQYQQALQSNPAHAEALCNLGMVFLRQGHLEEAIAQFEKALEINPSQEVFHYDLGVALSQGGKLDLAVEQFQEALKLKPDYAEARASLTKTQDQVGEGASPKH